MRGKVKTVNSRGFGFIETELDIDFFFHHSQVLNLGWKQLLQKFVNGEKIYVEFENNPDATEGPQAVSVRILNGNNGGNINNNGSGAKNEPLA